MEDSETIDQMFGRFQTITNNLRSLGKTYDSKDHVRKILRSLSRQWRPKVTAIQEAKDLNKLSLEELLGSLKVHELELKEESHSRREKSVALKINKGKTSKALKADESSEDEESSEEGQDSEEDELSFISRKIQRMWKKRGGPSGRKFNKKFPKDKAASKENPHAEKDKLVCFECKKPGHFRSECPDLKDKRKFFKKKRKGLMCTFEDVDLSDSEEEDQEQGEEANLCFMAQTASDAETSDDEVQNPDPESLQNSFNELLHESSILSREYKSLRKQFIKIKNSLEKAEENIKILEKENNDLKTVLDKPAETEQVKSTSSCNCSELKQEVAYLSSSLSKLLGGQSKMKLLLRNTRSSNDKTGLGFTQGISKKKTSPKKSKPAVLKSYKHVHPPRHYNVHANNSVHCTVCGKGGHTSHKCRHKKHTPQVLRKTNQKGPKAIWVPKNMIIPLADVLNSRKKTPVMVPGQWVLTSHDRRKVYVPKP